MSTYFSIDLNTTVVTVDTSVISSTKVAVIPPNDPSPDLDTKGRLLYFKETTGIPDVSQFQVNWLSSSTVQQMTVSSLQCLTVFEYPANFYSPLNFYGGMYSPNSFLSTALGLTSVSAPLNKTILFLDLQTQSKSLLLPPISLLTTTAASPYYVIKDSFGNASSNPLYISTLQSATIDGRSNVLALQQNFASLELLGDVATNRWHILNYYGSQGWLPTSIDNCQVWLDAADTNTINLNGSNITAWYDKSGSNNNASQITGAYRPTYNSSLKNIQFNSASSQYFSLPDNALPSNNNSYAYFIVCSFAAFFDGLGLIGGGSYGTNNGVFALRSFGTSGQIHQYWWNNDLTTGTGAYTVDATFLLEATYESGGARATLTNGTQLVTDTPGSRSQGITNNTIGVTATSEYMNGIVKEVLVYNSTLTNTQRQQVEGYLAWKWNLESYLGLTHPYKSGPPLPGVYPASWSPKQIAGCSFWIDAFDRASFSLSGSSVTSLLDKSVNGITLSNSSGYIWSPNSFNGYPSFSNLSNTSVLGVNASFSLAQPMTIFTVGELTTPNSGEFLDILDSTTSGNRVFLYYWNTPPLQLRLYSGNPATPLGNAASSGGTFLNSVVVNGTSSQLYESGTLTATVSDAGPGSQGFTGITVGNRFNYGSTPEGFRGRLCEILIYNSVLGTADRQRVEGYLAWKWGLAGSLPSNHPYKIAAPSQGFIVGVPPPLTTYNTLTLTNAGGTGVFFCRYTQEGRLVWATRIEGGAADAGWGTATDGNGNVFVAGFYASNPITIYNANGTSFGSLVGSGTDGFLVKYDPNGTVLWAVRIGGTGTDNVRNIMCDGAGNVYVAAGYTSTTIIFYNAAGASTISMAGNGNATYVVKYNTSGTPQWAARIYGVTNTRGMGVDTNGNVVVGGYYNGTLTIYNQDGTTFGTLGSFGSWDTYVVRYNTNGVAQWSTRLAGSGTEEVSWFMTSDKDGNAFVTGYFSSSSSTIYNSDGTTFGTLTTNGSYDIMLVKYNTSGFAQWSAVMGGSQLEEGRALTIDANGNSFVSGYYRSSPLSVYNAGGTLFGTLGNSGDLDSSIVKYSPSGAVQWAARIGGASADYLFGMTTDADGNLYITGDYISTQLDVYNANGTLAGSLTSSGSSYESYLIKYTPTGTVAWMTKMDGTGTDVGYAVSASSDSVYVTGAYTASPLTVRSVGF